MEKTIINFNLPDEMKQWETVSDTVMGGLSSSHVSITENETALFQGEVSLENYGGFTSMRTLPREFNLSEFKGLTVRVRGDGKDYRLRLRTDDSHEGIAYQAKFTTQAEQWLIVRIPFNEFMPAFHGKIVTGASDLDVKHIKRIGIMIADKQAGPFCLEIEWIKAYS